MSSRTRGLWWKEWRQLRLLRLGGAALVLVAPVLLLSAAESAKRGWAPFGALRGYSAAMVVQDVLPMFLGFLIWPLLALMMVAQSYCGDVAAGTEWFWMERPVQPRRVWTTRLLAALASLGVVIALHGLAWRLMVTLWGEPRALDAVGAGTRWFLMGDMALNDGRVTLTVGLLAALGAFFAALAASALSRSPMQALPIGLILAVLPLGLGQLLQSVFPFALVNRFNVASMVPLLLFVVYGVLSYRTCCRGEPAGRGKLARGLTVLGVGLFAVVALSVPTGLWATHRAAKLALPDATARPSPSGDRLFLFNAMKGPGWLFDVGSAEELLHFPPYVFDAAWEANGERLAVLRVGSANDIVVEVYDRDGKLLVENLECGRCLDVAWVGEWLASSTYVREDEAWRLELRDPVDGARTSPAIGPSEIHSHLVGPTPSGEWYVTLQTRSAEQTIVELYPLDAASGQVGEPVPLGGFENRVRFLPLAPDGSAVIVMHQGVATVVDLPGGASRAIGRNPAWLQPARPVWGERDGEDLVLRVDEEGVVRTLERFEGHGAFQLHGSPDGSRLLLVRDPNVSSAGGLRQLEHWLYDADTDRWTELEHMKVNDRRGWPARVEWVGDETVVLRGSGVLAFCEPAAPGSLRFVKGTKGDRSI